MRQCKSVTAKAPVLRGAKVIGRLQAKRTKVVRGRATLRFEVPEKLFGSIVASMEDKRTTRAPLKVEGRDVRGRAVRFKKATARFLRVVYTDGTKSSARATAGGVRQSATECPSPRYVAVSVPDVFAGVKG